MHRHAYIGRKLQRPANERKLLMRSLGASLILHERIITSVAKAKELAPYVERLITDAKSKNLANRRRVTGELPSNAAAKLLSEVALAMADRQGGYTRIIKIGERSGDNAPMAQISLVLPLASESKNDSKKAEVSTDPSATLKPNSPKATPKTAPKAKSPAKAKVAK